MKLTLCGSIAFINEMDTLRQKLEALGHEVKMPPMTGTDHHGNAISSLEYYAIKKQVGDDLTHPFWAGHEARIRAHFDKVAWCDAVLIANYDKNGVAGYVGPNTLMEMGLAFFLRKKIFMLQPIPAVPWREEILGMKPVVIGEHIENYFTHLDDKK